MIAARRTRARLSFGLLAAVVSGAVIESARLVLSDPNWDSNLTVAGCAVTIALAACAILCAWFAKWVLAVSMSMLIAGWSVLVGGVPFLNGAFQPPDCTTDCTQSLYYTAAAWAGVAVVAAIAAGIVAAIAASARNGAPSSSSPRSSGSS